jgi:pyruvate dehydrogenase E2 component (dihydrolipoamide acetyltransferase)
MPVKITMPALSPTMEEGNMGQWFKKEGDSVAAGDLLAEIETDKATMELEAIDDGTLAKIVVAEGTENVPVNAIIAVVLEEGEDASALDGMDLSAPAPAAAPAQAPAAAPAAAGPEPEPEAATPAPAPSAPAAPVREAGERIKASPLARRMAAQAGLDLAVISGSGPSGRIVKADIETAIASGGAASAALAPAAEAKARSAPAARASREGATEIPHTPMRKGIAKRLLQSKQTVPHFYLTLDCTLDKLLATRAELNAKPDVEKLSVNDFIIRAVALALRKVPEANASWTDDAILMHNAVDVSVAVAMEDGLITPIIFDADAKGLSRISAEMKDLAARARAVPMELKPREYEGGTISISNLGMFGIKQFDAIINPPQGCILAVGAGEQRPVVVDGALAVATVMSCTLSCDHRVVDGAVGARFLGALKTLIEDPLAMLL